jgi:hypothetical protein
VLLLLLHVCHYMRPYLLLYLQLQMEPLHDRVLVKPFEDEPVSSCS